MTNSSRIVLSIVCSLLIAVHGVELTVENYDELTADKTVFLKFYDPMCGNCIKMANAWEELEDAFEKSNTKLIGEIDCTDEASAPICEAQGIDGFPTLKWGSVYDLQEYGGSRSFLALKKFADKHLKPLCGVGRIQLCDKATRKDIRRWQKMTLEELDAELAAKTEEYIAIEKRKKEFVENLEAQYEKAQKEQEAAEAEIKNSGLPLMKAVASYRRKEIMRGSDNSKDEL